MKAANIQRLRMTPEEFQALPEYSTSVPTEQTPGKRWRSFFRNGDFGKKWFVGEYGKIDAATKTIAINWYQPIIVVKPLTEPLPDWRHVQLYRDLEERAAS